MELKQPLEVQTSLSEPILGRPWQGTVLGVLSVLGLIFWGLILIASILFVVWGSFFTGYFTEIHGMQGFSGFWGFGLMSSFMFLPLILMSVVPLMVLQYYLTKGIFAGQRWAMIVSIVLTGLVALSFNSIFFFFPLLALIYVCLMALLLYLEIKCIKHPFYRNEIIKTA